MWKVCFCCGGVGGGYTEWEVCGLWAVIPGGLLPVLQQQPCRCHRCSLRDEQSGSNSQLLLLFLSMSTFVSSPCCSHHFCFKHGRVNLHILQAASLPIYLSSCFAPPSPSFRQGCAVRLFQSAGVVTSDGWLSTFCCLPLRSWEIYRLADYQAWKPISLSHSSLPSSIHAALAPSILLPEFLHLLCYPKNFYNREMCAEQYWNLCVDTGK